MIIFREEVKERIINMLKTTNRDMVENGITLILEDYNIISKYLDQKHDIANQIITYLNAKKVDGLSMKTLKNYGYILRRFTRFIKTTQQIHNILEITVNEVRNYLAYLSELSLQERTIASNISVLKSFFLWLLVEDVITINPMIKIKSIKVDKLRSRKALTQDELERIRNVCLTYKEKAIVEFFVSTGCRISEAVDIYIDDIDFHSRCVKVIGKGNKERIIYFTPRAKLMIEEYIKIRKGGTALFASRYFPYAKVTPSAIQHTLKNIGIRAKIEKKVHPHLLRHTFATNALNSGMEITVIQRLLGHSEISTTQIYALLDEKSVKYEYEKLTACN